MTRTAEKALEHESPDVNCDRLPHQDASADAARQVARAKPLGPCAHVQGKARPDVAKATTVLTTALSQCGMNQRDLMVALGQTSHSLVTAYCSATDTRSPSLCALVRLTERRANHPFVAAIANQLLAMVDVRSTTRTALESVAAINAEVGDVARVILEREADGVVTRPERLATLRELREAIEALQALESAEMRAMVGE